jgi:hypothetical protein
MLRLSLREEAAAAAAAAAAVTRHCELSDSFNMAPEASNFNLYSAISALKPLPTDPSLRADIQHVLEYG